MAEVNDIWYRYDAIPAATADASVCLTEYRVTKVTPQGVWLVGWPGGKFVNNNWRKKFAYPTKEEAMESFKARKKAEIRILESRLVTAKAALKRAESGELQCLWEPFSQFFSEVGFDESPS